MAAPLSPAWRWIYRGISSIFFLGYIPLAPGTWGSAAAVGFVAFLKFRAPHLLESSMFLYHWVFLALATMLIILIATRAQQAMGPDNPDPGPVVIDEFLGQMITFFMMPITIRTLILGFFLFRFYDIIKPYPVHKMEELDEGAGIVMDDVAAGVMANITMFGMIGVFNVITGMLNS